MNIQYKSKSNSGSVIRKLDTPKHQRIGINTAEGLHVLNLSKILCCEALNNYCRIHLSEGEDPILVSKTLKHVASYLPESSFYRIHQSFIVQSNAIKKVNGCVELINGFKAPISRQKRPEFLEWMRSKLTVI